MGEDLPDDEPGYGFCLDCLACFPANEAPCYVQLLLRDVEQCPGTTKPLGNGRKFILEQRFDLWACLWYVEVDNFIAGWTAAPVAAGVRSEGWDVFIGLGDPCDTEFTNESLCVPGAAGTGGICTITWGPGINQASFDAQF